MMNEFRIPKNTRIGHVHLKVSDLERALEFYSGLLGFKIIQRHGTKAAFIASDDYHHHIGLNTWESEGQPPAPKHYPGLFHTAILIPTRLDLALMYQRISAQGYPFTGFADHGVSEALYLDDPDGNGVEIYWDKPKREWPYDESGNLQMYTKRLDLDGLIALLDQ